MQVNYYSNITLPTVISIITPTQWFDKIKNSEYSETITQARNGKLPYTEIKSSLPCITYNFLFNGYKKEENIIAPTGLMYIDIDTPEFDLSKVDTSKVYCYYKSFGGHGYAIIVQVDGLSKNNFKPSYLNVCKELGIYDFIDTNAIKSTQFNVLSYDEDIFINENSYVFTSTENSPQSIVRKEKETYTIEGGESKEYQSIRFNNLDEIEITGEYIVDWNGIEWVNCFIPFKKRDKGRNAFLLSYTNNLLWLNPKITKDRALKILTNVNKVAFTTPVPEKDLLKTINSILKYKNDGSLRPIYNWKPRKIVFKQGLKLNKEDKLTAVRRELAIRAQSQSRKKITTILENWNYEKSGKITQTKMYKDYPISSKTVEKYWNEFKEHIKELNKTLDKKIMTALNNLIIILINTPYFLTLVQSRFSFYK